MSGGQGRGISLSPGLPAWAPTPERELDFCTRPSQFRAWRAGSDPIAPVSGPGKGARSAARCVSPRCGGSVSCGPECLGPGPPRPSLSTATERGPAGLVVAAHGESVLHTQGEVAFLWGPTTSVVSGPRPAPALLWGCSPRGQRQPHPWPIPWSCSCSCISNPLPPRPLPNPPGQTAPGQDKTTSVPGPPSRCPQGQWVTRLRTPRYRLFSDCRGRHKQVWGAGCLQGKEI